MYHPIDQLSTFHCYYRDTYTTNDKTKYEEIPLYELPREPGTLSPDWLQPGTLRWEKEHRGFLIREVEEYIQMFPELEWMYMGERGLSIEADEGRTDSKRVISIRKLEDEWSYFWDMFGYQNA